MEEDDNDRVIESEFTTWQVGDCDTLYYLNSPFLLHFLIPHSHSSFLICICISKTLYQLLEKPNQIESHSKIRLSSSSSCLITY
ncbi:uncharacterized protein MELLADRAFT_87581 [Melampsora larici-populina 98AG31]|uniref:Uncharacterized protein n=1 Tax=Melampsora larici-populina (strain 98AG31 / pathotype 3-4-7) TaxID=747676 RepID=F4SDY0_MELLP|nr:uncharacterized protein MELLADRAFT_87581 [Melampsora larici-populina 98AG31]EGF97146.1 hypothetical protein MELLADRAFT_87581 [Melampsora larici-populina 98AG31]